MSSITVKIECVDLDGAQKMKRAFLKNTLAHAVSVVVEEDRYYVALTLDCRPCRPRSTL